jgi:phenylacetate-coenzyme A ligase PaaK-like adenylate-forming protein
LKKYNHQALEITSNEQFLKQALHTFQFQYENIPVYKEFVDFLKVDPVQISSLDQIPFLPISLFKSYQIISSNQKPKITFKSSGTTGMERSEHSIYDLEVYEKSFRKGFEFFYGDVKSYAVLALLPSYLEQGESSLVYMVDDLIHQSENIDSGFYLDNYEDLVLKLKALDQNGQKTILLGVSYALLDLIEQYDFDLKNTIVMETGGMKGRRKEMIKEELHQVLKAGFGVSQIHSEYGMTELLSQAYSKGNGIFETPPWMKILIRDATDPLTLIDNNLTGGINVIDLSNYYSCSFIATQDLGKKSANNTFEIVGRFDYTDIRGCNLLLA